MLQTMKSRRWCTLTKSKTQILVWITMVLLPVCTTGQAQSKHFKQHLDNKGNHIETLSWVIKLAQSCTKDKELQIVDHLADMTNLSNHGQILGLKGHYLLIHQGNQEYGLYNQTSSIHAIKNVSKSGYFDQKYFYTVKQKVSRIFNAYHHVEWYTQQVLRPRMKRSLRFEDPAYPMQWHLNNTEYIGNDINVTGVWERNITGRGVTVAVVDDGLEWTNPDIQNNYSPEGSLDLDSNDDDPMPRKSQQDLHGTRCAGEIAAVPNTHCAVGVAYGAKVSGIRVNLDGAMTDSMEASAFGAKRDFNDVYSCSWGPEDDGKTVDGPHVLAKTALKEGVHFGRHGYGSIFVVASGNGGMYRDNCNFDGYANSIYTITIGAVDEKGAMPYYAEECASMLAVTFSSGSSLTRNIATTDTTFSHTKGCTSRHTGTSAAAPIAAGMIALMLQSQPCLSWRDIQHIIAITAVKVDVDTAHWQRNEVGLHHSHKHGFGLMDAWRMTNAAKVWKPVLWLTFFTTDELTETSQSIPKLPKSLLLTHEVQESQTKQYLLNSLEQVVVTVSISHQKRGQLEIRLVCPSGTESVLGAYRDVDRSRSGFQDWAFSTVRCWGETAYGKYQLIIKDKDSTIGTGSISSWKLTLYGSAMTSQEFMNRIRIVNESYSGELLNDSYVPECHPVFNEGSSNNDWMVSERVLKFLTLTGAFLLVISIYQTFEFMLCYRDEKKEQERRTHLALRAQQLAQGNDHLEDSSSEMIQLLPRDTTEHNDYTDDESQAMQLLPDHTSDVVQLLTQDTEEPSLLSSGNVGGKNSSVIHEMQHNANRDNKSTTESHVPLLNEKYNAKSDSAMNVGQQDLECKKAQDNEDFMLSSTALSQIQQLDTQVDKSTSSHKSKNRKENSQDAMYKGITEKTGLLETSDTEDE